ncbi:MAG: thioredoxin family protein [Burkholderiales bacterium]|nr:thioredoxin family protein [Burkholderiales bacterium]
MRGTRPSIQEKLISTSERQRGGKLFGVFLMGAISALIVGPCVTAPLVGTLVYISKTGDAFLGGSALFAMAIGMGTPLLLMGLSAGSLLPKAGMWMDAVKKFFGVLLLAVALWLVSPILPSVVQMLAWATLLIGYGVYLLRGKGGNIAKLVGVVVLLLGTVQGVGVASGSRDPLAPLDHFGAVPAGEAAHFQRIKTVAELDQILAANPGKRVMLDFYADWCVSCKEMEKLTFPKPEVKQRMSQMLLLQVDVTANDAADKEMLKRFHLFGPPGIIFFDCKRGHSVPFFVAYSKIKLFSVSGRPRERNKSRCHPHQRA